MSQVISNEDITIANCLELSPATSTVNLMWGEEPKDLDTHFYGPTEDGDLFHLYYVEKEVTVNSTTFYLDVDDTNSYGPEILTIPVFTLAGRYQYIVNRYSGESGSTILQSPTRVELNFESQIRVFSPPEGEVSDYWHVFDFVVSESGDITIEEVNAWTDGSTSNVSAPASVITEPLLYNSLSKISV